MCTLAPREFCSVLNDLGQQYTHISVFKFWNVCCEACLAPTPSIVIDATHLA